MKIDEIIGQQVTLTHIKNALRKNQIAQAYMIIGEEGMGKKTIAMSFAESILCENRKPGEYEHCGKCDGCHQVETGNHPDLIMVMHEKAGLITVDEIREQVVTDVEIRPYEGRKKVYIIPDAEMMNEQAQNALLKTLEEPPEYAVLILLVANADRMLPTLRSRSIKLELSPLPDAVIEQTLITKYNIPKYRTSSVVKFARGNPGRAIEISENDDFVEDRKKVTEMMKKVVKTASYQWSEWINALAEDKSQIPFFLDMFLDWYRDILMAKAGAGKERLMFSDEAETIMEEAREYDYEDLKDCVIAIERTGAKLRANVNPKLALENLFNELNTSYRIG